MQLANLGKATNPSIATIAMAVLAIAALGEFALADEQEVRRLSEPVLVTPGEEVFGDLLDRTLPSFTLAELEQNKDPSAIDEFLVETRVSQVCQAKGCFFIAQDGDATMRVSFKDYSFFVPTNISGKVVTLSGTLVERHLTPVAVEHFKADLASSDTPLSAGTVYEIVATAVSVPL
ncbi:MAG: DUF4920 domain-containing protein [Pseudomonadota bacterium]